MSYQQHNPYGRVCANCSRPINGGVPYYFKGPDAFCSPMCSDTHEEQARRLAQMKAAEKRLPKPTFLEQCDSARDDLIAQGVNIRASEFLRDEPDGCGVDGCFVCSGAIRSRAGKGDQSDV